MNELKKCGGGVPVQIKEAITNWQLGTIRKVEKLLEKIRNQLQGGKWNMSLGIKNSHVIR